MFQFKIFLSSPQLNNNKGKQEQRQNKENTKEVYSHSIVIRFMVPACHPSQDRGRYTPLTGWLYHV